ncbi:hypothetical protein [Silanimonas sp.]|jgi:hypothetical protein|uniref:hypothetical protein n=1 Tax=Silanimonas sp. TaxID=1929290 RepID=UPI0037C828F8
MSTTPWDILGIGDDADAKAIKRAYARALKSTRPDEDPIGFQRLNDAYEWALGAVRHRDANATPPTASDEGLPTPDALPELGRPVDAPPDLPPPIPEPESQPVAAPDEGRGFDFGAFFDALAPRLAKDRPATLQSWLDEHPDLYSIDLKWALIPHVVDALARSIDAIRPRPDNVAALMAFFGVDARLRRHPALAPALDHIDASLVRMASGIETPRETTFASPLASELDAETLDAERETLRREIGLSLDGRGRVLTTRQAALLQHAIDDVPRWRVFLDLLPPNRQRDAQAHLGPHALRLQRWQAAGVDVPNLELLLALSAPAGVNGPKALLSIIRILLAGGLAAPLLVYGLAQEPDSPIKGLVAAGTIVTGATLSVVAALWLLGLAFGWLLEAFSILMGRLWPWIQRQTWSLYRWILIVPATLLPLAGWPGDTAANLALGFSGFALAWSSRPKVVPLLVLVLLLGTTMLHAGMKIEAVSLLDLNRFGMALGVVAAFAIERVVQERDLRERGTPREGWGPTFAALWMAGMAWFLVLIIR